MYLYKTQICKHIWKLGPPRNMCEAGDHVEQEEQKLEIFG